MQVHYERIGATLEENTPCQREDVFVVSIAPENASQHLVTMNNKYPLPERLGHVKRIWRRTPEAGPLGGQVNLFLLISPVEHSNYSKDDWRAVVAAELGSSATSPLQVMQVPRRMPLSRVEYEEWRREGCWPTSFHEDKNRIREDAEELDMIRRLGSQVIPALLARDGNECIIVDPRNPAVEEWVVGRGGEGGGTCLLREAVMSAVAQMAARHLRMEDGGGGKRRSDVSAPYLCTGQVAFCTHEPSVMSAMALIHSRIRSVVFIRTDPLRGGVFSRLWLQDVRETNHHFSVFRAFISSSSSSSSSAPSASD